VSEGVEMSVRLLVLIVVVLLLVLLLLLLVLLLVVVVVVVLLLLVLLVVVVVVVVVMVVVLLLLVLLLLVLVLLLLLLLLVLLLLLLLLLQPRCCCYRRFNQTLPDEEQRTQHDEHTRREVRRGKQATIVSRAESETANGSENRCPMLRKNRARSPSFVVTVASDSSHRGELHRNCIIPDLTKDFAELRSISRKCRIPSCSSLSCLLSFQ
jgi:hypothetical protein